MSPLGLVLGVLRLRVVLTTPVHLDCEEPTTRIEFRQLPVGQLQAAQFAGDRREAGEFLLAGGQIGLCLCNQSVR